ncbi:alpha/beta hydrolase [Streptomyces sp. GMY02]|nr:alpha/beta hydrolase [Streptomyces sp. GMY02]
MIHLVGTVLAERSNERLTARTENRDVFTTLAARDAQYDAIVEWGVPDRHALSRLQSIVQPTLVTQGDNDLMIPTRNSYLLAALIPDAELRMSKMPPTPPFFQYPERYAADVNTFLNKQRRIAEGLSEKGPGEARVVTRPQPGWSNHLCEPVLHPSGWSTGSQCFLTLWGTGIPAMQPFSSCMLGTVYRSHRESFGDAYRMVDVVGGRLLPQPHAGGRP